MTNQSLEFLEIYTSDGLKTGKKATKSVIHKKGLFHATVHVWIFSELGNVLIQKRSNKIDEHFQSLGMIETSFQKAPISFVKPFRK